MKAADVMSTHVVTLDPDMDVRGAARMLAEAGISGAPVVDRSGKLVGLLSEGDLMRRPESGTERKPSWWLMLFSEPRDRALHYVKTHGARVREVMTSPVITVTPETELAEIADRLERHRIKRVPVIDGDRLVGIVSRADLLRGLIAWRDEPKAASDAEIEKRLLAELRATGADTRLLTIMVSNGAVRLWGALGSKEEKNAVRLAAQQTPGVHSVADNTSVLPDADALPWAE